MHRLPSCRSTTRWVTFWAVLAGALSAWYVHSFLHDGPRIIDATSYWMQARGLSEGKMTWDALWPSAASRGRFLLSAYPPLPPKLGVIFPPGYPAFLSLFFLLHIPMWSGPVLAAILVITSSGLAFELSADHQVTRVVAILSTLNAALRYHTADTMSHGLAAVCATGALWLGFRAVSQASRSSGSHGLSQAQPTSLPRTLPGYILHGILAGVLTGALVATRPVSGGALILLGGAALLWHLVRHRNLTALWALLGLLPGVAWLIVEQHAVTGQWLHSTQMAYYALADGPAGCFRYGFGQGIGCLGEHGQYVETVLPDGFGLFPALRTTGTRLYIHLGDIMNYGPFASVCWLGLWWARRQRRWQLLSLWPLLLVAAYAPFYFNGSYPGGGARLFAEALPVEHVFAGFGLVIASRAFGKKIARARGAFVAAFALPLLGAGWHALPEHRLLEKRDGARPMFEPSVLHAALGGTPKGLLFISTDHGYNLAFDPACRDPHQCLVVARQRFDAHDRFAWQWLGKPQSWSYRFDPWARPSSSPSVVPWKPPRTTSDQPWRWELEHEWPPLAQHGGYAIPTLLPHGTCASNGRALGLTNTSRRACVTVGVPFPEAGAWTLSPRLVLQTSSTISLTVRSPVGQVLESIAPKHIGMNSPKSSSVAGSDHRTCTSLPPLTVTVSSAGEGTATFCSTSPWVGLDVIVVEK